MQLSIVTTLYHSSAHIDEFYQRITKVAKGITNEYEIIVVNDGSPDNALEIAVALHKQDAKLKVIDLSRNFGHHKAIMTGLAHATGDHIFLIDSDLEEEPEWLEKFMQQMRQEDCDVVYGVQKVRKGRWFERLSGACFYKLFRFLTNLNLPKNIVVARLMTRRYVKALLQFEEREVFLAGLWHITGFKQNPCSIKKHNTSKTTYTLRRRLSIFVNSVTSFSNTPLIAIFYIGVSIFLVAALYAGWLVSQWLFMDRMLSGWTSIMVSMWLLGGLIISFIGIIGVYLAKVFSEAKRRPYTIIRKVYERQ